MERCKQRILSSIREAFTNESDTDTLIYISASVMLMMLVANLVGILFKIRVYDAMLEDDQVNAAIDEKAGWAIRAMCGFAMSAHACGLLGLIRKASSAVRTSAAMTSAYAVAVCLVGVWDCFQRGGIRAGAAEPGLDMPSDPGNAFATVERYLQTLRFPFIDAALSLFVAIMLWACACKMAEESGVVDGLATVVVRRFKRRIARLTAALSTSRHETKALISRAQAVASACLVVAVIGLARGRRCLDGLLEDVAGDPVDGRAELAIRIMYGFLSLASVCGFLGLVSKGSTLVLVSAVLFFTYSAAILSVGVCYCFHLGGIAPSANVADGQSGDAKRSIQDLIEDFITRLSFPFVEFSLTAVCAKWLFDCAFRIDDEARQHAHAHAAAHAVTSPGWLDTTLVVDRR